MIQTGEQAPDFELPDQDGNPVRLSELRGRPVVLGVSPDPVDAIKRFADDESLDFRLLADADHAVAERYGTWGEKSMYGKTYMGVMRSTLIIDADGTVVHVIPKASPKTHDDQVLKALRDTVAA